MLPPPGGISSLQMWHADQRRMKKRHGSVTKTTPTGAENKLATELKSHVVADLKLFINLVFFMSFFKKRLK